MPVGSKDNHFPKQDSDECNFERHSLSNFVSLDIWLLADSTPENNLKKLHHEYKVL